MQVIRDTHQRYASESYSKRLFITHVPRCLRAACKWNRRPGQQQQQQLRGFPQHPQRMAWDRSASCKAVVNQEHQSVGLQDVPLIPLQVLLGNPLYSSAKVRIRMRNGHVCLQHAWPGHHIHSRTSKL
jgi:hypothetical protein